MTSLPAGLVRGAFDALALGGAAARRTKPFGEALGALGLLPADKRKVGSEWSKNMAEHGVPPRGHALSPPSGSELPKVIAVSKSESGE